MTARLPLDIHCHSEYSHDADFMVSKMCEAAMEKGVEVFAITDHYDIYQEIEDFSDMDKGLRLSVRDMLAAREASRHKLDLLIGIELGQPLENKAKAEEILSSYDFDFVLGSMHNPPGIPDFYFYRPDSENYPLEIAVESYFVNLLSMVHWGRFDCAAHLTLPFRYILRYHTGYAFGKWDDHLESIVKALAEKGLAMEINTSGLLADPPFTMPDARWVRRFKELGGERITLGSDAHSPQRVGTGIPEGIEIAREAGFTRLCYFRSRQPQYVPIG